MVGDCHNHEGDLMTKESTKKAFTKAFSDHILLNLSEEEEASIREYFGLDKPTPTEQEKDQQTS